MKRTASILLSLLACAAFARAETPPAEPLPTLAVATEGLARHDGLLTLWKDDSRGKLWIELPPAGADGKVGSFLYVEGLVTGLGSNPVGLDRGQLGAARLVELHRRGGSLLVVQPNLGFRAMTGDAAERGAVRQSFARSVLWAGPVAAEDGDGRFLVELTSFVVRDAHGVAATLASTGQGSFRLDADRSVADLEACLVFPDNIELEAWLTFGGDEPGAQVRAVTPEPTAVTLVQHQSLVRLPDDGYRPRRFDPRAGSFAVRFADYAAPLDETIDRRWIVRHRLKKTRPGPGPSPVEEPIVYYVDRAAPEPVRSALIEGASWWAEAFEQAGFRDAFRVEILPEDAHPLDVRYNVIQWVHRATRGWSYGGGVIDPRTGEMVKGHVSLGSLRVRQDRLLFEGLLGTDRTGGGGGADPLELALARIRQLSAHEVGHTLGMAHNFAASTYGGRASVMDYPAPWIRLRRGRLDVRQAYGVGVGVWDAHAVRYAYSEFPAGADESAQLDEIVADGLDRGWLFLGDADARPAGAAHPLANLWDNGDDPLAELEEVYAVRRFALDGFGEQVVAPRTPMAYSEEVLATVYLHHRFQLAAALKNIGGLDYRHRLRGDTQPSPKPVPAERQRRAWELALDALEPEFLDLPDGVHDVLHPRPPGSGSNREMFALATRPAADGLSLAATAADLVLRGLFQRERCARLVEFHRRDSTLPGLEELLAALEDRLFAPALEVGAGSDELREAVRHVALERAMRLAADPAALPSVRARLNLWLRDLVEKLEDRQPAGPARAHRDQMVERLRRFFDRPHEDGLGATAPPEPPGQPIGTESRPSGAVPIPR